MAWPLALLATCALGGCASFGSFELVLPIAEQHVNGNPLGDVLGDTLFEVPVPLEVNLSAETAARDTGPARRVVLTSLSLRITTTDEPEGDEDDFSFVDDVDIYVESAATSSDLPRVRVAYVETVEAGARGLSFTVEPEIDLLPYLREGARLTSRASGRAPPDDVSFDGELSLAVEVL